MRTHLLILILFNFWISIHAQTNDSIVYEAEGVRLVKNVKSKKYTFLNKKTRETYSNLKFAKRIYGYFQVLDTNNEVYYLNEAGEKKKEVRDYMGLCGTVPYYKMTIKENRSHFKIFEDETFLDWENKIPAKEKLKISKAETDTVLFINGKDAFDYSSNFTLWICAIDPETLIFVKDGKYFTKANPKMKFDAIDFSDYHHSLKTRKNNLYGILGVTTPKYKKIEKFNYYLAKAVTKEGNSVYIDIEGNEY